MDAREGSKVDVGFTESDECERGKGISLCCSWCFLKENGRKKLRKDGVAKIKK